MTTPTNASMPGPPLLGEPEAHLRRALGLPSLVLFGLVYIVPLTVFTTYGIVTETTGGRLPVAYIVTLVAMGITALSYARMVVAAYGNEAAANKRFILHGPEGILFHDAVKRYCAVVHPHIPKVSTMPHWLATFIAATKGPKELRAASDFMAAFEKIGERGDPGEANDLLGAPRIRLDEWLGRSEGDARRMPAA